MTDKERIAELEKELKEETAFMQAFRNRAWEADDQIEALEIENDKLEEENAALKASLEYWIETWKTAANSVLRLTGPVTPPSSCMADDDVVWNHMNSLRKWLRNVIDDQ